MEVMTNSERYRAHALLALSLAQDAQTHPERTAIACEGILSALLAISLQLRGAARKKPR